MTVFEKYIWVLNSLFRAGDQGISLKDLNDKWVADDTVSGGQPLPRQTFDRWKRDILMIFGVDIECQRRCGYRYRISNPEALSSGELNRWLLDTYTTATALSQNLSLSGRIVAEDIPSSRNFLPEIMSAMKGNRVVDITYKGFELSRSYTFAVEPFCLKMFQRRWYMLARNVGKSVMRIYGLDRIEAVTETGSTFRLPDDFDAKSYFTTYFGVVLDSEAKPERVVVRAYGQHRHYMRSLPLHQSQVEIGSGHGYADFELYLCVTYDLVMELLRAGSMIEVISPAILRHEMHQWVAGMWKMYEND